jgi:hypothetical protein
VPFSLALNYQTLYLTLARSLPALPPLTFAMAAKVFFSPTLQWLAQPGLLLDAQRDVTTPPWWCWRLILQTLLAGSSSMALALLDYTGHH